MEAPLHLQDLCLQADSIRKTGPSRRRDRGDLLRGGLSILYILLAWGPTSPSSWASFFKKEEGVCP